MTSCSYTDSFRLEADVDYVFEDYGVVSSPNGCYEESISDPVESGEAASRFYSDGSVSDYEYYFRAYEFDDTEVWTIATYLDGTFNTRCKDYYEYDYTTLHPTEVSYWACEDDDGGYTDFSATISTICGCDTPAPTPAPTTPDATAAPATQGLAATPGPTPNGLTPAPRTTSDEVPAGEVAGGVVAGVVVVVAVVLAALFKTGRLKMNRTGKQRKLSRDDVASGSGSTGNTPPAASESPVHHQYPIAYQYPEAI